jgi:signal transduction histidine kinase
VNIKELLETIKDTSRDYIGVRGYENDILCQDLTREELDLIVNEIERLNNIINELEKFLKINSEKDDYDLTEYNKGVNNAYNYTLDKLKELKEK